MELVFATHNLHKSQELNQLLSKNKITLYTLQDFPEIKEIRETGKTFMENALLKGNTIFKKLNRPVLADDSGIEVEYLDNRPGVYSKRYAGPGASDTDRINKLLKELTGVPFEKRKARFVCSMVLITEKKTDIVTGYCNGYITTEPKGKNGFGYDPVFFLPDLKRTMAQLKMNSKNVISHRANALKQVKSILIEKYEI